MSKLLCRRIIHKFNSFIIIFFYNTLNFIKRHPEKFSALIDEIKLFICKSIMQSSFKSWCIIRKYKCMHIEIKRHGGIAKLIYSIHRLQSAGHAYFINPFAKCADV